MSGTEAVADKKNATKTEAETTETTPFEYQWPQDNAGEYYLLGRQICEYLKEDRLLQKYSEIQSHEVSKEEKKFLFDQGAIPEAEFHSDDKVLYCFIQYTNTVLYYNIPMHYI